MPEFHSRHDELAVGFSSLLLLRSKMTQHRIDIEYASRVQSEIGTVAAVLILLGRNHHLCPHRVEVNVAN